MEFLALDGTARTGETWCPGPEARSVWVLMADGPPRAVKLATGKKPARELKGWPSTLRYVPPQWRRLEAKHAPPLSRQDWQATLPLELRT